MSGLLMVHPSVFFGEAFEPTVLGGVGVALVALMWSAAGLVWVDRLVFEQ